MTDQGSTRAITSWASRVVPEPSRRAPDGVAAGLRVTLGLAFTAAAAAAAPTVSAACFAAWDGFRFFVFVAGPDDDLGLGLSSVGRGGALADCGVLATIRPGI